MVIQHNLTAANANRQLANVVGQQAKSTEKLSSGYRINRAADDAAGLSISEKMRGQIRGLDQASTNAQDGISLIQTAEGALNETHAILQRMRELTVQASNGTTTEADRGYIKDEMDQLTKEIDRISSTTEFNTMKLLDGSFETQLQIGANSGQTIEIGVNNMNADALGIQKADAPIVTKDAYIDGGTLDNGTYTIKKGIGQDVDKTEDTYVYNEKNEIVAKLTGTTITTISIDPDDGTYTDGDVITLKDKADADMDFAEGHSFTLYTDKNGDQKATHKTQGVDVSTTEGATLSLNDLDTAINSVSKQRSSLGAVQNRLEHTISNLDNTAENLQSAESNIRDVDMAKEMVNHSKNSIIQQAAQSMLAQANQSNQGVLSLLQ